MGDFSTTRDEPLITRSKRHFTPDNFLLKIESFSLLSKSGLEYKSDVFEAGGHKWLSLHPKGIEKNKNDHISLYLAIAETGKFPLGWEVNASFKLFVFDQILDEYLTIQDAGGRAIRRFNDIYSEWGIFPNFFPLIPSMMLLKDTLSITVAYLVQIKLFVHERSVKRQCLSFIVRKPYNSTFTWKIERFSTLDEERYYSQEFTVGDSKWKLLVCPKGHSSEEKPVISGFLCLCNCLQSEQNVFAEFKLLIMDKIKGKHKENRGEVWFSSSKKDWGFPEFLLLKDLGNASKGFLVNDTGRSRNYSDVLSKETAHTYFSENYIC